ncbi:MAG: maltose/maltodextrin ABC transporter substrate-binding protein MalE [Rhodocyclaceae bacterium]|nr:maltose/maltodextrin ABC transporter substrate-binding protein MalE [Rhodocyclaceae bacterium]
MKPYFFRRALLLALYAAYTAFFSAHAQAQSELKLLVWINGDKGYTGLQKIGDTFARVSGVKVVVEHPVDAPSKFQQATGAGKGPDIFCWPHDRAGEWAKSGLIVPVRPNKKLRSEIEESAWKAFTFKGNTWGYPLSIETISLIYNKSLVPIPPTSFDQIPEIDKALKAQRKRAILWDFNKSFFTWPLLAGGGGYVFGVDTNGDADPRSVGVNAPGAIRAGELLAGLIKNGQMPAGARYAEMESGFSRSEIAMMISGPWAWENAKKSRINFGVAPIPDINGRPAKPFVGVLGCMIAAPSRVKDIAREFMEKYVLTLDGLKTINADVPLGVPANKAFYRELSSDPNIRATMQSARQGEPIPNIPETAKFWGAMDAALEAITNGLQSPKDALNAAAARMVTK